MSRGGAQSKEILEELMDCVALGLGRLKEAAQDAVVSHSRVGTSALNDSAHDHRGAQTPPGLGVGRGGIA